MQRIVQYHNCTRVSDMAMIRGIQVLIHDSSLPLLVSTSSKTTAIHNAILISLTQRQPLMMNLTLRTAPKMVDLSTGSGSVLSAQKRLTYSSETWMKNERALLDLMVAEGGESGCV